MAFEWNQGLSVGVDQIDAQHKELFARVNRLLAAASQGKGRDEIGATIDFLADYVVTHFGTEERIMSRCGYSDFKPHKDQHERFLHEFSGLKKKFEDEGVSTLLIVLIQQKVCDWLTNHVSKVDRALGKFVLENKVLQP